MVRPAARCSQGVVPHAAHGCAWCDMRTLIVEPVGNARGGYLPVLFLLGAPSVDQDVLDRGIDALHGQCRERRSAIIPSDRRYSGPLE